MGIPSPKRYFVLGVAKKNVSSVPHWQLVNYATFYEFYCVRIFKATDFPKWPARENIKWRYSGYEGEMFAEYKENTKGIFKGGKNDVAT